MKVRAIVVTEYASDTVLGVRSFLDDDNDPSLRAQSKFEAEEVFRHCVRENGDNVTDEELEEYVKDGYFEQGDYQIFITRSS